MNKSAFLELIQQASNISDQQTEELEKVAATFPYCQTAHLLLAKSAFDKGSMLSTQRLRRASAYATNRQVLKRIIYTSPAPAPAFDEPVDEPVVEEQIIPAPSEKTETAPESTTLLHQEEVLITPIADDVIATEELEETFAAETEIYEVPPVSEEIPVEENPYIDESEATESPVEEEHTPEQPEVESEVASEEAIPYELAQLLTINSLNSSFTDLLAQKPDIEAPERVVEAEQHSHVIFPDHFKEADDELAQLIEEESAIPPQGVYVLEESLYTPAATETETPEEDQEAFPPAFEQQPLTTAAAPEDAPVNYSSNEIDRMYAEDALGYWMASSRMGEVLQLKDEVTRQRPAGFHPELILEYSKTHELEEKPEEPKAPSLHQQLNIIDQFLKLNPRLKTMNNIKMKQEPQEDLSLRNSKIKKGIASESLATIFLNQGKVKKAIKIYEQLILKYPEKKSYFAEQIEKLQNLD